MKKSKLTITIISVAFLLIVGFFGYNYFFDITTKDLVSYENEANEDVICVVTNYGLKGFSADCVSEKGVESKLTNVREKDFELLEEISWEYGEGDLVYNFREQEVCTIEEWQPPTLTVFDCVTSKIRGSGFKDGYIVPLDYFNIQQGEI